jgi:hypothetical protein
MLLEGRLRKAALTGTGTLSTWGSGPDQHTLALLIDKHSIPTNEPSNDLSLGTFWELFLCFFAMLEGTGEMKRKISLASIHLSLADKAAMTANATLLDRIQWRSTLLLTYYPPGHAVLAISHQISSVHPCTASALVKNVGKRPLLAISLQSLVGTEQIRSQHVDRAI